MFVSKYSFKTNFVLSIFDGASPLFANTPEGAESTEVIITYLNEGAANVIWDIKPVDPKTLIPEHRPFLEHKLLRLRKGVKSPIYTGKNIIPPLMPTEQVFDYYDRKIKPLFGKDQLVEQLKVTISPSLIASCDEILDVLESDGQRPDKRIGWHLANDDIGLLMTSMASTPNTLKRIEFKPKWLAQSPTAPAGSVRCRTCALAAFRFKKPQFCPLRLTELDTITSTSNFTTPPWIDPSSDPNEPREVTRALASFFARGKGHSILQTLKQQQILLDPNGVSQLCVSTLTQTNAHPCPSTTEEEIANLSMAMTLRDCTFFVNVSRNEKGEVVIDGRLADLDPKSGDDAKRLGKWYWDERELIEKGWYEGTGAGGGEGAGSDERGEECWLWKGTGKI